MPWSVPIRPTQTSAETQQKWTKRRQSVGRRIRSLRVDQGLSQEALALESGLSRNMIISLEFGRRGMSFERLWDIADVLGIPITTLLSDLDEHHGHT
ncbi:helix-turn-helix domain-containing protein [Arthrobacter sp. Soc17.1.1.1]|uniref:helix-turn-helix domain-containing protein n=1 Tax=Arthrobacter sp. Soc17.1.1.1 TaxID=3121277 RepID=UPI003FA59756